MGAGVAALLVLAAAVNLRPAVAAVGPVLPEIGADLRLGPALLAVLTAGPILCFGLFAPLGPRLALRWGVPRALVLVLAVIAAGLALRLGPGLPLLLGGTLVAAVGIAIGNVLVPAFVRGRHRRHVGVLMGVYTVALSASGALASAASVPLATGSGLGWHAALGAWTLPALLGTAVWAWAARGTRPAPPHPGPPARRGGDLLRHPLAWAVTGYFALQALSYFTTLTWLAPILRAAGWDATRAGLLLSLLTLAQLPASLLVPIVAARLSSQRPLVLLASTLSAAGLAGLLWAPAVLPALWVLVLGLGQGVGFALALSLMVLRSRGTAAAASLSAMTQTVGYTVAGLGPLLAGALQSATGTWSAPVLLLLSVLAVQLVPGLRAAAPGTVDGGRPDRTAAPDPGLAQHAADDRGPP